MPGNLAVCSARADGRDAFSSSTTRFAETRATHQRSPQPRPQSSQLRLQSFKPIILTRDAQILRWRVTCKMPFPPSSRHKKQIFTMPTSTYQRDLTYPYNLNRPILEHDHFWRGPGNPPPGSASLAVRGFTSVGNAFLILGSGAREHVWEAERDGDKGHSIKA